MRFVYVSLVLSLVCGVAFAQRPLDVSQELSSQTTRSMAMLGSLTELSYAPEPVMEPAATPEIARFQRMKAMIKKQVNKAIDSNGYPTLMERKPPPAKKKSQVFLQNPYSPQPFANAAIDEAVDRMKGDHLNPAYERGMMGASQRYGIELSTNETDIFFLRFLCPT